jgi:hypothetical protein
MNCDTLYDDWGLTVRYRALFIGCGSSGRGKYRNLAFENVVKVETGEVVRAHTWIPASEFNYLMKIGDCVSFDAHVGSYEKQGRGFRQLGLGFTSCRRFWTESHGNVVTRWNPKAELEVAA